MILNNRIEVSKQFPRLPCLKKKCFLSPTMSGWLPFFPVLVYCQNLKDFNGLLKGKALINLSIR
jgi:hypothetical protein